MSTMTGICDTTTANGLDYSEEQAAWLTRFSPKTLLFYARPLLAKWLKTFKSPEVLLVSQAPVETAMWHKRFKAKSVGCFSPQEAQQQTKQWDCLVFLEESASQQEIADLLPLLKKGGAFLLVSRNLHPEWQVYQEFLESQDITLLFPVGFHPKGAVAWWPFNTMTLVGLGQMMDGLATFFPARYELGLRFGQCWMIRGLKRDDITLLT